MDVEALVRPVIERAGFEFVEAEMTREDGRRVLRVTVDRPDGLDLDSLADLSVSVSHHLDDEGLRAGRDVRARGFLTGHRAAAARRRDSSDGRWARRSR